MSKILIIEDDTGLCELLRARLESEHFSVAVAQEGMQGVMLAHSEKPDLILLDLVMPLGGGMMVLRNIKMSTHTKKIPVIVISGTSDGHLIDQIKNMGIAEYMAKPFDVNDLVAKIKEILGK